MPEIARIQDIDEFKISPCHRKLNVNQARPGMVPKVSGERKAVDWGIGQKNRKCFRFINLVDSLTPKEQLNILGLYTVSF